MKERKGKKWEFTRKDYRTYHFTAKETAKYLLEGVAVCAAADYLFYQSLPVLLFMLPVPVIFLKIQKKKCIARQQRNLNYQFRDALTSMNVAVQAGYSAENAVRASVKDLGRLYEKGSDILEEFRYIESQLRLSVPVEELFLDFGKRSGVEDIENFAAVFYTAKRTGGDMTQMIQKVARMLGDKIEVKKEIEATLAAKKSEQMVMSVMPAGIICYLKLTSPGFLDVLYGNPFGICAMTVCMVIYGLSYWLGVKIVDSPPQGTIYVTVQKTDCFLHISITDEGGGFTPEALHHAQEQFFMGDKSRTSNMHFGMGLYITSSIIKQHGGQLVLSNSKKTGGAQVIIKIPY